MSGIIYLLILIPILTTKHLPPPPPSALLRSGSISASASGTTTPVYKEHSIGSRIRALTMLNDKIPMARIIKAIGISRSQIYNLAVKARERG
jgi:hypothetical protein